MAVRVASPPPQEGGVFTPLTYTVPAEQMKELA